jgi:uncharacterized protein
MIEVRRELARPRSGKYIVSVDGVDAGYSIFTLVDGLVTFLHTEIDPPFEGRGLGSKLARGALDDVRAQGFRVVARCPFIAAYIERHPEDQDLLVVA